MDRDERRKKFLEEWGDDLLFKTTGSILMKPKAYYKRIPGHPMAKEEWWEQYRAEHRAKLAAKKKVKGKFLFCFGKVSRADSEAAAANPRPELKDEVEVKKAGTRNKGKIGV